MATTRKVHEMPDHTAQVIYTIDPEEVVDDYDMIVAYVNVANGVVSEMAADQYREGHRNCMMLDLTVSTHMMGIDVLGVLDDLLNADVILGYTDDEDPYDRASRALNYSHRFNWDYMINPERYEEVGKNVRFDTMPVLFQIKGHEYVHMDRS